MYTSITGGVVGKPASLRPIIVGSAAIKDRLDGICEEQFCGHQVIFRRCSDSYRFQVLSC